MSKRKMSLLSSFENISPQVISRVGREIQDLQRNPPDGIRFLPQEEETIAEIHAEIKGPAETPYDGGSFHIKLVLSNDFPHSPPRGFFLTKIYHPNVASNGDICVNTLKRDWTAEVTISHVLQVIRCLLIVPFPESSLNDEAGRLFMESYSEYERRCKVWVSVHASKSLSGEACSGGGGTVKGGAKVKGGKVAKPGAGVAAASAKSTVGGAAKKSVAKNVGSKASAKGGAGQKSVGAAAAAAAAAAPEGGGSSVGGGTAAPGGSKRREEPTARKTVKDRQKEAKKKGLKRL